MKDEFHYRGFYWKSAVRWGLALIIVLGAHVAGAFGFYGLQPEPEQAAGLPPAIMLEFAEDITAPVVENISEELQPETQAEEVPEVQEQLAMAEPDPLITPPSDFVEEIKKPEKKTVEKPEPPKKEIKKAEKPENKKPPEKFEKAKKDVKTAENTSKGAAPQINARPDPKFAAPHNSRTDGAGGKNDAGWIAKVQRKVNAVAHRMGRQVPGGRGLVGVRFSYDASGRISSARVVRSSGNQQLDALAIKVAQRSSPIPAPPDGRGDEITLPVRF